MNITVFLEGSPGHEKQSMAIVGELEKITDVNSSYVTVERQTPLGKLLKTIGFLLGYSSPPQGGESADLLIGTGSHTHIALLSAKRKFDTPAIICMAPDPLLKRCFDLCFVPRHDGLQESETVFITDGPPVPTAGVVDKDEKKGLILIGGPNAYSSGWKNEDICGYVQSLVEQETGKEWTLSTSPRTPADTSADLREIAGTVSHLHFFDYKDTPSGWVEERYAESAEAWVTVDSMSMIYEALTAGCRVGLLPLEWKNKENKFSRSMNSLIEQGYAVNFNDWIEGTAGWKTVGCFNEARRCAEEIVRRWGRKN